MLVEYDAAYTTFRAIYPRPSPSDRGVYRTVDELQPLMGPVY